MNIFYDTEFINYPKEEMLQGKPELELISIGMIKQNGDTYYAVSSEFDVEYVEKDDWLRENVLLKLGENEADWKSRDQIAEELIDFCGQDPTFWAYYPAHDHTCLYSLYGRLLDSPKGWPMRSNCLKQVQFHLGVDKLPEQEGGDHNALADAKWNKEVYEFLLPIAKEKSLNLDFQNLEKRN